MLRRLGRLWSPAVALVACLASPLASQSSPAESVRWLAGCWEVRTGDVTIEEQWLEPRAGTLLGTSRTTRSESLLGFEFMRIYSRGDTLVFAAQPSGRPPTEFVARLQASRAIEFENSSHDFPQSVHYRAVGSDSLYARIEGLRNGQPASVDFPYTRASCPPGA